MQNRVGLEQDGWGCHSLRRGDTEEGSSRGDNTVLALLTVVSVASGWMLIGRWMKLLETRLVKHQRFDGSQILRVEGLEESLK